MKAKPKKPAKKPRSKKQISYAMSRVRSSGSAIELTLARALWRTGIRYRKQYRIFGRPDFVVVKHRIAIFCDSEFWHGYRWGERRKREHKTNHAFWFTKIERNRARDRVVTQTLKRQGWHVFRFWERRILNDPGQCAAAVTRHIALSSPNRPTRKCPVSPRAELSNVSRGRPLNLNALEIACAEFECRSEARRSAISR